MIKIAICDDEPLMAQELAGHLAEYMKEKSITAYDLSSFPDGRTLLDAVDRFDVIFLDIQMEHLDGMETAKLLRQRGDHSLLVFVTVLKELVFDAFQVEAYDYLAASPGRNRNCGTLPLTFSSWLRFNLSQPNLTSAE